jgi:thioredoxin reductase (NADPH)
MDNYDVIIIGGGPAGLSAGIYTARARRRCLLLEMGLPGGLITTSETLENYPGFPDGIGGMEIGQLMQKQAERFGLEILMAEVSSIDPASRPMTVKTSRGDFAARAIIVSGGSDHMKLGVPGEAEFTGKGVSYCATCDGFFYQQKKVAVVGGGDAALEEARYLSKFADRVYLIHRRSEYRATAIMQEKINSEAKIVPVLSTVVTAIEGEGMVSILKLENTADGKSSELEVDGIFVSVGYRPNTSYLQGVVPLDKGGYVITGKTMATEVPGIYAAGDIRQDSGRQVITAAGDGATAAIYAEKYLSKND